MVPKASLVVSTEKLSNFPEGTQECEESAGILGQG